MKKTVIIFTGGTISMKEDPMLGGTVPALDSKEILSHMRTLSDEDIQEVEAIDFGPYAGPQMTPESMMELTKIVREKVADENVDGVVITHGTDTLEETAYFLDLAVHTEKPIVVVGSMRNASELGYDGPSNIASAIITVKSQEAKRKGVLVVLNNQVNSAREVTKTHTLTLDTFKSPEFGPLGIVDNNEVLFMRQTMPHSHLEVDRYEEVFLLKTYAGMTSLELDFLIEHGAKGIVIEAMGRGNVPPSLIPAIQRGLEKGVIIVVVSRCPMGRVLGTYAYDGGGKQLQEMGVFFGTSLNGQKMRIKLMLALGYTSDRDKLKEIVEKDIFYVDTH